MRLSTPQARWEMPASLGGLSLASCSCGCPPCQDPSLRLYLFGPKLEALPSLGHRRPLSSPCGQCSCPSVEGSTECLHPTGSARGSEPIPKVARSPHLHRPLHQAGFPRGQGLCRSCLSNSVKEGEKHPPPPVCQLMSLLET